MHGAHRLGRDADGRKGPQATLARKVGQNERIGMLQLTSAASAEMPAGRPDMVGAGPNATVPHDQVAWNRAGHEAAVVRHAITARGQPDDRAGAGAGPCRRHGAGLFILQKAPGPMAAA
ncbi:MAG: hypothetical protein SNJ63_01720 [Sphingomonadaceae bacterium]